MNNEIRVYIGTYTEDIRFGTGQILEGKGEGIYLYQLEKDTAALKLRNKITGIKNPSFLTFSHNFRYLYAVNELKLYENRPTGTVSAFSIESNGDLTFLNKRETNGTDPCHVSIDKNDKFIQISNFMSGSICVFPILNDGSLGESTQFIQNKGSSINPTRQAGPHAHSFTFDHNNKYGFVPDLGIDKLMIYRYDQNSGKLNPGDPPWIATYPGAGPRHFTFHPLGRYAYLINELNSTITAFTYNNESGAIKEIETVNTLPKGFSGESTCADIHISPSGLFLYSSNRGHDSIVIYKIDQKSGKLNYLGHEPSQGKTPRNFAIDPTGDFLLVANQDSDNIAIFHIDKLTGKLQFTGNITQVPTPVCIRMYISTSPAPQ